MATNNQNAWTFSFKLHARECAVLQSIFTIYTTNYQRTMISNWITKVIFAAIALNLLLEVMGDNTGSPARNPPLVYSRHDLLKLRDVNNHSWAAEIPADIRPRKRGKRGGVRRRFRRRWRRVPLPSIIMGNLRSINNKTDELAACTRFIHEYRESSVMCFTET